MTELEIRTLEAAIQASYMADELYKQGMRPFMMLRPRMFPHGNQWCALYGENMLDGVCSLGDTPVQAAENFDIIWNHGRVRSEHE